MEVADQQGSGFETVVIYNPFQFGSSATMVNLCYMAASFRMRPSSCARLIPVDRLDHEQSGFVDVRIGPPADTFGGAGGESKARLFEVFGYAFLARKPK
jgi:hypothetical protein